MQAACLLSSLVLARFDAEGDGAAHGGGGGRAGSQRAQAGHAAVVVLLLLCALIALQRSHPWHWSFLYGSLQFSSL